MDTVIRTKFTLLPNYQIAKNIEIHINESNGTISYIGPLKQNHSNLEDAIIKEFPKGVAMPAFINAHTHIPETLIRGLCDDKDLLTWLFNHVWQLEPYMTDEHAKIGTQLGIAEMISSGTIGFIDQFYFADKIAEAVSETGVKALIAPSIFENELFSNEVRSLEKAFSKNKQVFDLWHGFDNRLFVGFGPHAPYTVEQEFFKNIVHEAKSRNTLIHTHLNESEKEIEDVRKKYDCSPIEFMNKIEGLNHTIAAHCIHTTENERNLLVNHGTTVLANPTSNLKTGSGIAPLPEYLQRGINVCLATDGSASNNNLNLLEEARLTALLHKGLQKNPKLLSVTEIIPLITSNASKLFPKGVYSGKLAENNPADIVIYDLASVNTTPIINPLSNWLFAAHPSEVVFTMANGKILYEHGQYLTLDIDKVKNESQKAIEEMMNKSDYIPLSFR